MCIRNNENSNQRAYCWRCGRMLFENTKTGRTGCRNTKCRNYLLGSKNLDKTLLKPVYTKNFQKRK